MNMDFQVKISRQAAGDLSDIIKYISDVLCSPGAAERFFNEVDKRLNLINKNPFMYPLFRDERVGSEGNRAVVIGNYLMFYIVDEANTLAYITRIVYGKRDITALFNEQG